MQRLWPRVNPNGQRPNLYQIRWLKGGHSFTRCTLPHMLLPTLHILNNSPSSTPFFSQGETSVLRAFPASPNIRSTKHSVYETFGLCRGDFTLGAHGNRFSSLGQTLDNHKALKKFAKTRTRKGSRVKRLMYVYVPLDE